MMALMLFLKVVVAARIQSSQIMQRLRELRLTIKWALVPQLDLMLVIRCLAAHKQPVAPVKWYAQKVAMHLVLVSPVLVVKRLRASLQAVWDVLMAATVGSEVLLLVVVAQEGLMVMVTPEAVMRSQVEVVTLALEEQVARQMQQPVQTARSGMRLMVQVEVVQVRRQVQMVELAVITAAAAAVLPTDSFQVVHRESLSLPTHRHPSRGALSSCAGMCGSSAAYASAVARQCRAADPDLHRTAVAIA
jgi:hypothetical protein